MARYPTYAPEFEIRIDGEPLPAALRGSVGDVSLQEGMEGANRVEVTFGNPGLGYLEHPMLQIDKGFKLFIGYAPDKLEEVFVGEITGVEPTFPNGGMPTIKIVAHDFLHRLTSGEKERSFHLEIPSIGNFPLPDTVVSALVAAENLLIPFPDPVGAALSVLITVATYVAAPRAAQLGIRRQQGISDFNFLTQIAKANGWEMYIDHTLDPKGYVLRFQFLIQDYSPSLQLTYGESLMDFSPRLTTVGDVFGVSARVWVDSLKMEFVISVGWDFDRAAFDVQVYPGIGQLPGASGDTLTVKPTGFAQAPLKILSELLPRLNNRVTGSGNCIGDTRIRAGKVIELRGLGSEFSGLYRITSCTHSLGSGGYQTSFQGRHEVWFGSIPLPEGASGLFRVQGQTIG